MNPFSKKHHFTGLSLCVLLVAITAGLAGADTVRFVNSGADQNWTNTSNWKCQTKEGIPGIDDEAIVGNSTVRVTTAVTVGYLKTGVGGPGEVIIDGGSLLAVGLPKYNSACYNRPGTLIVKNGGSASFKTYFMVGFKEFQGGAVEIHDGTIRVSDVYYHNKTYSETDVLNTRTTIYTGGLLDVDQLELNAGVLDIAGGTVIVRKAYIEHATEWIEAGRIIAMGGKEGWKINATNDAGTGHLVMVAEPPAVAPTEAGKALDVTEAVREEKKPGPTKTLIIGVAIAGLLLLILFSLFIKRKKSEKEKAESGTGSTYEF